jgi:hypothetical protein
VRLPKRSGSLKNRRVKTQNWGVDIKKRNPLSSQQFPVWTQKRREKKRRTDKRECVSERRGKSRKATRGYSSLMSETAEDAMYSQNIRRDTIFSHRRLLSTPFFISFSLLAFLLRKIIQKTKQTNPKTKIERAQSQIDTQQAFWQLLDGPLFNNLLRFCSFLFYFISFFLSLSQRHI